jgi:rhodanese-related sulfurtransferase
VPRALDDLLAEATSRIRRYSPAEARDADATLVDIRSGDARERDGVIPGAYHVPRTVLEWRVASRDWRNTELDGKRLILVCDHGYSSILAAAALADLGIDAGDLDGGFEAWVAAGLPVTRPAGYDGLPGTGPPD